jgi:DNA-binding NarL/FixJ family response regulator
LAMHDPPAVLPEQDLPTIDPIDPEIDAGIDPEADPGIVVTVQEADIEAASLGEAGADQRPCSLLVSGDSPLFCESLARLMGAAPDLVAAHAALEHLAEAGVEDVTVLLLNVHAYRKHICQVVDDARKRWPGVRILLLVKGPAPWCDRLAAEVGAHGWLTRHVRAETLIRAVLLAHRDIRIAPDRMFGTAGQKRTAEGLLLEQLTERETEVLRLLSTGQRGDAIARLLNISPNTVRTHIQNLIVKLGVHTRLEAVAFARRNGLLATPSADGEPQGGPTGAAGAASQGA